MKYGMVDAGEVEAGRAFEAKKEVEKCVDRMEFETFKVADLLSEIKNNVYYEKFGLNSFKEYVETLPFKSSKANYLVRIVDVMQELNISKEKYEPLGTSKLREITSLNPSSVYIDHKTGEERPMALIIEEFIDKCEDWSVSETAKNVREAKGGLGDEETVWVNYSVPKAVKENILDKAVILAKMHIGSVGFDASGNAVDPSDGSAWEAIAVEFLNDPKNEAIDGQ